MAALFAGHPELPRQRRARCRRPPRPGRAQCASMAARALLLHGLPTRGTAARLDHPRAAENLELVLGGDRHAVRPAPGSEDLPRLSRPRLRTLLEARPRHREPRRPGRNARRGRCRYRRLRGLSRRRRRPRTYVDPTGGRGSPRLRCPELPHRWRALLGPRAPAGHPRAPEIRAHLTLAKLKQLRGSSLIFG